MFGAQLGFLKGRAVKEAFVEAEHGRESVYHNEGRKVRGMGGRRGRSKAGESHRNHCTGAPMEGLTQ